jgi:hypothetical protein
LDKGVFVLEVVDLSQGCDWKCVEVDSSVSEIKRGKGEDFSDEKDMPE